MDGLYAENAGAIFCLVQGFITKKMVASRLALRELKYDYRDIGGRVTQGAVTEEASAALQLL